MTTIADERDSKPYTLLTDDSIVREVQWLLSLYLEQFACKGNQIPCAKCRSTADKLTPLFLVGIDAIGKAQEWPTHQLAKIAINKMFTQKWTMNRPWKPDSIPVIIEPNTSTSATTPSLAASLFSGLMSLYKEEKDDKKSFTYKLVKRTERKSK